MGISQWKLTNVPGDGIAPAERLHPVHTAGIHPDEVARPLHEPVVRDARLLHLGQVGPPRAPQKVDVVALAEPLHQRPVLLGHAEPLAVAGPHVQVERAEVVVLLVAGRAAAGHLKLQKKLFDLKLGYFE